MSGRHRWKGILFGVSVTLALTGIAACTSVIPITTPQKFLADSEVAAVWITRNDGPEVRVDRPQVRGDTLTGSVQGRSVQIPFSEITSAKLHKEATDKLVKVTTGVGVGVAAAFLVYKVTHQTTYPRTP